MGVSGLVAVELSDDERDLLWSGLHEWGGPATATDALAQVMGFADVEDLLRGNGRRLRDALRRGDALPAADWRRVLLATEIVFASDVVGSGIDWSITTGLSDEQTVGRLRSVQRKLGRAVHQG